MAASSRPVDPITIDLAGDPSAGEQAIKELCKRVLPGWESQDASQFQMSKISGGISNLLVKVTPPASSGLQPVAVKVFGDKTELFIDRDVELQLLLRLNDAGFGAQVLAMFTNGRIEEFLTATTLRPEEMADPHYVPRIAAKLRQLHGAEVGGERKANLFELIESWLSMAQQLEFDSDAAKGEQYKQIDFATMTAELAETRALCEATASPVVFAHNDLLSGNILVIQRPGTDIKDPAQVDTTGPLQFIDFEYSTFGYRGFDFGNHFNEYAGFDCDYGRYPEAGAQKLFFKHYLGEDAASLSTSELEQQLERMVAEANIFALASHAYWGIWAIIQARYSPIDFDYLAYSRLRWDEYRKRKPAFVAEAKRLFGIK